MEEYVIGFVESDPESLTPIDVVIDVTGLTKREVKSCYEVVNIGIDYGHEEP